MPGDGSGDVDRIGWRPLRQGLCFILHLIGTGGGDLGDRSSFRELTPPLFGRRVVGKLVQAARSVVIRVCAQQPVPAPLLDCTGRDGELVGALVDGQQPPRPQPFEARLQSMVPADRLHSSRVEGTVMAGSVPAFVEDGRDLGLGAVVEQGVDLGNDLARGLVRLPRKALRSRGELAGRSAAQTPPNVSSSPLVRVTSSISNRAMRFRSRRGVAGSFHKRGKSVASARMRWRCESSDS